MNFSDGVQSDHSVTGKVWSQSPRQTDSSWFPLPDATQALLFFSNPLGLRYLLGVETPNSQGEGALQLLSLRPAQGGLSLSVTLLLPVYVFLQCSIDIIFPISHTSFGYSS